MCLNLTDIGQEIAINAKTAKESKLGHRPPMPNIAVDASIWILWQFWHWWQFLNASSV
jgi:hypothetical protein